VRSAIRGLLAVCDQELECELRVLLGGDDDYRTAGKPVCDYDDRAAREALVDGLAKDARTLLVALDKLGFQIAPLVAAVGVAGVGVGFAFHGVLANIIAGLSIVFTKPYRVGEYIELLDVHGQVLTIELFSTTLAQLDQSRVVIPNHKIVGEILHNYGTIRQLQLKVGVAYSANLNEVLAVAKQVVAADVIVIPRSLSCSIQSVTVLPSSTSPIR